MDAWCRIRGLLIILVSFGLAILPSTFSPEQAPGRRGGLAPLTPPVVRTQVDAVYSRLPLHFEPNQGQTDPRIRFLARGQRYGLFLTSTEAVMVFQQQQAARAVWMRLVGANPEPKVEGLAALPGKFNYLIGSDPQNWRTNIPTYANVQYRDVYPGVTLTYYGTQTEFEFDLVFAPGVDPGVVTVGFEGVDRIRLDGAELVLDLAGSEVRLRAPRAYQEVPRGKQAVSSHYVVKGPNQIGFRVGAYDRTQPLTIDPVLSYSTYLGGSYVEYPTGVAVDSLHSAYITGGVLSADFPTTAGAYDTTLGGGGDAFVTKLNALGTALVFSTYLGGSGTDSANSLSIDTTGNVYVTGFTESSDFPTTPGAYDTTLGGGQDAFVTKLNATGSALVYSTYLGGTAGEGGYGIAVDTSLNAYVTGYTSSGDFPTTQGAYDTTLDGGQDAFVTKLNAAGSTLVYSTYLGGSSTEQGTAIAVDASFSAYVRGITSSADFPTTPGAYDTTLGGPQDLFVTKLNAAGSGLTYSTYLGGSGSEDFLPFGGYRTLAVDAGGSAYVTGYTDSSDYPTTVGAFATGYAGSGDAFVTKLNPAGSGLTYSTYLGGSSLDLGLAIAIDANGNAYITGITRSANFPTASPVQSILRGMEDAFVTKLNATGSALTYSTYLGGSNTEQGHAIAVDVHTNVYVAGGTSSADFPTTPGAVDAALSGPSDIFVARISSLVTAGLYNPATSVFFMRNSNTAGFADITFPYGPGGAGWIPIAGDWNGDGVGTVGLYNPAAGLFFLRNSNTSGVADVTFAYGPPGLGWIPIAGDWNGDGTDTVGLYNPAAGLFFLRNSNTSGFADMTFAYGPPGAGWIPIAGDWDGDGVATVGLYNPMTSTFFLRNSNTTGVADITFAYGPAAAGWLAGTGDWDGNGTSTAGLYNPATSTFFLRNSNTSGVADVTFGYGPAGSGWIPLTGDWDGL